MHFVQHTLNLAFTNELQKHIPQAINDAVYAARPVVAGPIDNPRTYQGPGNFPHRGKSLGDVHLGPTYPDSDGVGLGVQTERSDMLLSASATMSEPQENGWHTLQVVYSRVPIGEPTRPKMAETVKCTYKVPFEPGPGRLEELCPQIARHFASFLVDDQIPAAANYQLKT